MTDVDRRTTFDKANLPSAPLQRPHALLWAHCLIQLITESGSSREMLLWERTDDCLDVQISASQNQSLFTMLLEGPQGSGKTAIAATLGLESEFPFVKVISSQNMMGYTESAKVALVTRTIEDAYRVRPLILLPLSPTLLRICAALRCCIYFWNILHGCMHTWATSMRPEHAIGVDIFLTEALACVSRGQKGSANSGKSVRVSQ